MWLTTWAAIQNTLLQTEFLFFSWTRLLCIPWTQIQTGILNACSFTSLLLPSESLTLPTFPIGWYDINIQHCMAEDQNIYHKFLLLSPCSYLFKAKLFFWKCESNTACLLAFFLHISTSYKPYKAHPSFSLTMNWGEKSGVRVWRKPTVRGQKACWEGKDSICHLTVTVTDSVFW